MSVTHKKNKTSSPRYGLARVISKLGLCSRSQAAKLVVAGRVSVNGRVQRDPERPTRLTGERIVIDGEEAQVAQRIYIALNKPRGLVVSAADERGRETIYRLLNDDKLPWLAPVGRLDKASEGLLLMTNDSAWAAGISDPESHVDKTYHVQIDGTPDEHALQRMIVGISSDGETLRASDVRVLRTGEKNAWLEVTLDEGRNRQIRRMLEALGFTVLRLVRVAIGPIALGKLAKGQWRTLQAREVRSLQSGEKRRP